MQPLISFIVFSLISGCILCHGDLISNTTQFDEKFLDWEYDMSNVTNMVDGPKDETNTEFDEIHLNLDYDAMEIVGDHKDETTTENTFEYFATMTDATNTEFDEEHLDLVNAVIRMVDSYETTTETEEIDGEGCNTKLRRRLEDKCDEDYEKGVKEAEMIKNDGLRAKTHCCLLENFEKCSFRAYDQANCVTAKRDVRENIKAARFFLKAVNGFSCTHFTNQCAHYSPGATGFFKVFQGVSYSYEMVLFVTLFLLVM